jgi:hypothetical protein
VARHPWGKRSVQNKQHWEVPQKGHRREVYVIGSKAHQQRFLNKKVEIE